MSKVLLQHIASGIQLLEQYVNFDVNITEVGGHIAIWHFDSSPIVVPIEVQNKLINMGWHYSSEQNEWIHPLSG